MTRLKARMNSLRFKLIATLLLIIIPLIIMLIVNTVSSVNVIRSQVSQSNKNMLSLYMNQSDLMLQEVDKFLINLSEFESDIVIFDALRSRNETAYSLAKIRIHNAMKKELSSISMDAFFIYSIRNEELVLARSFGDEYADREKLEQEILTMIHTVAAETDYSKWQVWTGAGGNEHYIFHLVRTGETYVGAWIDSESLLQPLQLINLGEDGVTLLTNHKNEPITSTFGLDEKHIDFSYSPQSYTLTGANDSWLLIGEPSQVGAYNIVVLMPDKGIMQQLPLIQRITTIILIAVILVLLIFFYMIQRIFLTPIKRLLIAMRKLRAGDWNMRIEPQKTSTEFGIVNETFNQMISEIHNLKINIYEEKINLQRAELKHLQLQINPHFFMNSLNIIYNLATMKDYKLVQEMTRCLVSYFRFMFKSNSYFVSLRDELAHTSNYLRIQQLRFPHSLIYHVEGSEQAMEVEVPPLIVQTMVENTIKYTVNNEQPTTIDVQAVIESVDDQQVLSITIKDTGPGFSEEVLAKLGSEQLEHDGSGEKIGIWNVRRRLKLLYEERAHIYFYNEQNGRYGAVVRFEIILN